MLAVTCLLAASSSESLGQVKMNVQMNAVAVGGNGAGKLSAATPERMSLLLDLLTEEMQSVCDLTDGQVKKLRLAGKSVSKKMFSAKGMQIQLGGLFNAKKQDGKVDENSLSDEDTEPETEEQGDAKPGQNFSIKRQVSLTALTKHALWKKAIDSVLSQEQQETWSQSQTKRNDKVRDILVAHRVADLEQQLLLRPEQISAVRAVVDRVEGDQLVKDFKTAGSNRLQQMLRQRNKKRTRISKSDLEDVLTSVQMEVWKAPSEEASSGVSGLIGKVLGVQPNAGNDTDMGLEFSSGLKVKSVEKDSRAAALGVQVGDVIDSVDGEWVDTELQFRSAIKMSGKSPSVTVVRDDAEVRLENK